MGRRFETDTGHRTCDYPRPMTRLCLAPHPDHAAQVRAHGVGHVCTRPQGHDGPHEARHNERPGAGFDVLDASWPVGT